MHYYYTINVQIKIYSHFAIICTCQHMALSFKSLCGWQGGYPCTSENNNNTYSMNTVHYYA